MKGSMCFETYDQYGGRCTRLGKARGSSMSCVRIGSRCRCKSNTILNQPPPVHETESIIGFEANLDVSLTLLGNSVPGQVSTNGNDTEYS